MPQTVDIPLQPLSAGAFASFGEILGDFDAPPTFEAPHLRSWRLDFELEGAVELMVARYLHQPFEFTAIERHFNVTQSFIPLGYQPSVMWWQPRLTRTTGPRYLPPISSTRS
jgi:ureidoglycolate lyase